MPNSAGAVKPIAAISCYNAHSRWCVKARVIAKSDVRKWKNARGEGQLCKVDLADATGEIAATFFGAAVDKFYAMLEPGKVFLFSRPSVKPANKKFDRGEFVLTFDENASIEPLGEDPDVPEIAYNARPLDEVLQLEANEYVDVVAVVYFVQDVHNFTSKGGKDLTKRDIGLWDSSGADGTCMDMTLWADQAANWNIAEGSVLFVKGARVSEFNGAKNLASPGNFEVREDDPRVQPLQGQYEERQRTRPLVRQAGGGGPLKRQTLEECREEGLTLAPPALPGEPLDPAGPKAVHRHSVSGTVTAVYQDRLPCYAACPELVESSRPNAQGAGNEKRTCNKKSVEEGENQWRCAAGHICAKPVWRYIARMKVTDHTDSLDVNLYDAEARKIFGCEAEEYARAWEEGKDRGDEVPLRELSGRVVWKRFALKLRAQKEVWQDEERIKHSVMEVAETDFASEARRLLADVVASTTTANAAGNPAAAAAAEA